VIVCIWGLCFYLFEIPNGRQYADSTCLLISVWSCGFVVVGNLTSSVAMPITKRIVLYKSLSISLHTHLFPAEKSPIIPHIFPIKSLPSPSNYLHHVHTSPPLNPTIRHLKTSSTNTSPTPISLTMPQKPSH
jgi:hypothetical protein